jgi:O-antigen ligase
MRSLLADRRSRLDAAAFLFLLLFAASSAFSIALAQIGYFTALALWLGGMGASRRWEWPRTPLDPFFLAYAVMELAAAIGAQDRPTAFLYLQRRLLLLPLVSLCAGAVRTPREAELVLRGLVLSAVGVAMVSLFPLVTHFGDFLLFRRRLGEFQIYMTAGGIQMIALLLILPFLVHRDTPRRIRTAGAVLLVPLVINLLFTFTRSAWLGFAAGILVLGVLRAPRLIAILAGAAVLLVLIAPAELREARLLALVDPTHPHNISRLHMWQVGWRAFQDYPLLGVGDIGMETIWPRYADPDWGTEGHLHNNIIMWAVTLGTAGLAVLAGLFVTAWRAAARIERRLRGHWFGGSLAAGGLAVMAGFHTAGLFEWNYGDAEILMLVWAVIGLVLAAGRVLPDTPPQRR